MKSFFLLLLFIPAILLAQSLVTKHNGTYTIDFHKKNKQVDSTATPQPDDTDPDEETRTKGKRLKVKPAPKPHSFRYYAYDFKTEGIFKGLFIAGVNACQIDGDDQYGYKYFGAETGVGVLARFHRLLSTSLEIDYTMKGAKDRLLSTPDVSRYYQVQWDYLSIPVALNLHVRDFLMFSAGLAPGVMTRYKEFNQDGINNTNHSPYGIPKKFDLDIYGAVHVIIRKHYAIGFKYSYSTLSIRDAGAGTRVHGQYNNVLTLRFVYILSRRKQK